MKIKFISVETNDKQTKTGKEYIELDVTYKNCDFQEKVESKKLNPFGNKDVYNTLKNAKTGDFFDIERIKNDSGFWDWVKIMAVADGASTSTASTVSAGSKTTVAPKSTYETAEERAQRQVMIVRQSSTSSAVNALKTDKKSPSSAEVIAYARDLEAYVFGVAAAPVPLADLPVVDDVDSDVPY